VVQADTRWEGLCRSPLFRGRTGTPRKATTRTVNPSAWVDVRIPPESGLHERRRCHNLVRTKGSREGTPRYGFGWSRCVESYCETTKFGPCPTGGHVVGPYRFGRVSSPGLELCSSVVRWRSRPCCYAVGLRPSLDGHRTPRILPCIGEGLVLSATCPGLGAGTTLAGWLRWSTSRPPT